MKKKVSNKRFVIIPAGGTGTRMGNELPKQFLLLNGVPVIVLTLRKFLEVKDIEKIIVALPKEWKNYFEELCSGYFSEMKNIETVEGGETRFHSVKNALALLNEDGTVAIHDAARPLVSVVLIEKCFSQAEKNGSAIAAVAPKDSVYRNKNSKWKIADRNKFLLAQTPQCFSVSEIKKAYAQKFNQEFTDDGSVYESMGKKLNMVEGEYSNIKITTPDDLIFVEAILKNEM